MRPDGSWVGHAYAGVVMCAEGVATYKCDGVGNMTEAGGVSFRGGTIFETQKIPQIAYFLINPNKKFFVIQIFI